MAEHSRYHVSNKTTGISTGILKNKLHIKDQKQLENAETLLLADAYTHFFELLEKDKLKFDLFLLFGIHKYFLETLYDWAGKLRTVDISKANTLFASIKYLNQTVTTFGKSLKETLPKRTDAKSMIAQKLALIHNEFNIIHPFRE